jgi:hypothetical protein
MRIDERLNLVIPVDRGTAGNAYVHVAPLPRTVFEEHYLLISKTFTAIMTEGVSVIAGPRVAGLMLRDVAKRSNSWESAGQNLLSEIIRLSNVAMPGQNGYEQLPLQTVIERKLMDDSEISEVVGAAVFFTVNSAIHKKNVLDVVLENMKDLWGTPTTSFNITEFCVSLQTSTPAASSGATTQGASVPS